MASRVQATPMRALQERSALSRSQRRGSTGDLDLGITPNPPAAAAAKQAKRSTRNVAASKDTYDRWGLDLSHFETKARLADHIKGVKAGELRHIEKWCSLSHDGLSWTQLFQRNISSTTQSYSRLRAPIYDDGSNVFVFEPGL
eukprot:SAG11_NODE_14164_length_622_cov_3.149140_1_plen_142_part_10